MKLRRYWLHFVVLSMGLSSITGHASQIRVDEPCDNAIARSAQAPTPDQALAILGACLATPAPLADLQRVALQMAIVSFKKGDAAWGMRYLEILSEMLAEEPAPPPASQ